MSSFPSVIFGDFGDEKATSSTKFGSLPLGVIMYLPDGSKYRQAKSSATAMIAGNLYQQNIGIQGTDAAYKKDLAVAANAAIGATSVSVTCGATTAVTKDQFEDGSLFVNDATGEGIKYKIKGNTSAAAGSTCVLSLYPKDAIKVALAAGTSEVGVRESEYFNLTINTADTVGVGAIAGIAPVAVTASYYCWICQQGDIAALTDGTLIIGEPVVPSKALAGAVGVHSAATSVGVKESSNIGWAQNVAASTEYSLVKLMIPG